MRGMRRQGQKKIELHFLPDVGSGDVARTALNPETLAVRSKGFSIADVLDDARTRRSSIANLQKIRKRSEDAADVGLRLPVARQPHLRIKVAGTGVKIRCRTISAPHGTDDLRARRADDGSAFRRHHNFSKCSTARGRRETVIVVEHNSM